METFYIIVLSVATILLILILAYFGIVLQNKAKTKPLILRSHQIPAPIIGLYQETEKVVKYQTLL